jgi:hypothetical protein
VFIHIHAIDAFVMVNAKYKKSRKMIKTLIQTRSVLVTPVSGIS